MKSPPRGRPDRPRRSACRRPVRRVLVVLGLSEDVEGELGERPARRAHGEDSARSGPEIAVERDPAEPCPGSPLQPGAPLRRWQTRTRIGKLHPDRNRLRCTAWIPTPRKGRNDASQTPSPIAPSVTVTLRSGRSPRAGPGRCARAVGGDEEAADDLGDRQVLDRVADRDALLGRIAARDMWKLTALALLAATGIRWYGAFDAVHLAHDGAVVDQLARRGSSRSRIALASATSILPREQMRVPSLGVPWAWVLSAGAKRPRGARGRPARRSSRRPCARPRDGSRRSGPSPRRPSSPRSPPRRCRRWSRSAARLPAIPRLAAPGLDHDLDLGTQASRACACSSEKFPSASRKSEP